VTSDDGGTVAALRLPQEQGTMSEVLSPTNGRTAEARLLVVDDEPNIVELLSASLRYAGFEVVTAMNGADAVKAVERHRPDLVVLDVMLPDVDGFVVLRRLRSGSHPLPVVFLTARDANDDKVTGLTLGGDDYVTKPFSLEEVVARIRAVLRRTRATASGASARLTVGDVELDEDSHQVWSGGREVQLSPTEFNLLRYLLLNAGRVVSKSQILDHVWSYDFDGDVNIVESYISYLRRKLDDGSEPLIHTVRGIGYVIRPRAASS
jgi:two-component system OmpR family response regulator